MNILSSSCTCVLLTILLLTSNAIGQLASNPSSVSFGNVLITSSSSQSVILSNTGTSNLTISQATVSGTGFSTSGLAIPLTLSSGQSVSLTATFAPKISGNVNGSLSLTYSMTKTKGHEKGPSNGTSRISLAGTGTTSGQLTANPTSLTFGNVQVGNSLTLMDSVTNTGGTSVTISQATVRGAGFSITGLNVPLTLAAGASVTFNTVFAPQLAASASGTISITSDAANPTLIVSLSGTGTQQGQLSVAPTALDFGSVIVGTSASQTSNLSASGGSVTVSAATFSNTEFSLAGISLPLTISAGQSVPFTLTFAPQTSGSASAVLSFTSNANNLAYSLSGNGVAPPQHSVSLSWADSGYGIVGYNIYRGIVAGGPYTRINSALDSAAAYSDSSVLAGQTYYYVTTAVDGNGMESAYSNEAQAVVPSP